MSPVHGYDGGGGLGGRSGGQGEKLLIQPKTTNSQRVKRILIFMDLEALQGPLEAVTVSTPEVAVVEKLAVIK